MNRTKRIKDIIEKNFNEFSISVTDDSLAHKGHNNFDGKEETHIIIELKKKFNSLLKAFSRPSFLNEFFKAFINTNLSLILVVIKIP